MKIVCISDTHGRHGFLTNPASPLAPLPAGDTIVHAGDISEVGNYWEVKRFLDWFSGLEQYRARIFVAGNHDWLFEENPGLARELLREYPGVTYLQDSGCEVEGLKFWGSPQTPFFYNWAFNRREEIRDYWEMIPIGTDVLITHGPEFGIADHVRGRNVGCPILGDRITRISRGHPLKLHVVGHIHEGYGLYSNHDEYVVVNASVLDEKYRPRNKPLVVEVNCDQS